MPLRICSIVLATFAAIVSTLCVVPAEAQREAGIPVRNIYEPGRNPYFSSAETICSNGQLCEVILKPVPAGYRLVVTYVSVSVQTQSATVAGNLRTGVYLRSKPANPKLTTDGIDLPSIPQSGQAERLSLPVSFYFEPGAIPEFVINNTVNGSVPSGGIVGYLVSLD